MRGTPSAVIIHLLRRWRFGLFAQVCGTHFFAIPLLAAPAAAFVVDDARAASAAARVFAHSVLHPVRLILFHKPSRHGRGLGHRIDASMRWFFAASWLTRRRRRLSASMPIVDRRTGGPPLRRRKHALRVARMREEQRVSASGVGRMRGVLATSPTNSTESCGARDAFHPKMSARSAWARVIPFMTSGNRNAHTLTTSCSGSVLCPLCDGRGIQADRLLHAVAAGLPGWLCTGPIDSFEARVRRSGCRGWGAGGRLVTPPRFAADSCCIPASPHGHSRPWPPHSQSLSATSTAIGNHGA